MKIGYVAPMSIAAVNGGLRNQALRTIEAMEKMDTEVVQISPWDNIADIKPDLVHIYGATVENIGIADSLRAEGIPIVLSPVFFSNRSAGMIKVSLNIELLTQFFGSGIRSDFSVKSQICHWADKVLPNTLEEAHLIEEGFSVHSSRITVVPNAVEARFANATPDAFIKKYGIKDFILFAGHAGAPRKNVKTLLEVATDLDYPVVIIGSFFEDEYGKACWELAESASNVILIDTLDHESELLASAYAACTVFVLPSQYETPGIAAMEAGLAGARIVITEKGGPKEYFLDHAEYITPGSPDSLKEGINRVLENKPPGDLKEHLLSRFTYQQVASQTLDVYKQLLS